MVYQHRYGRIAALSVLLCFFTLGVGSESRLLATDIFVKNHSSNNRLVSYAKNTVTRRAKDWLRRKIVQPQDMQQYGLYLNSSCLAKLRRDQVRIDWQAAPPIVIFVHGFNSSPERHKHLTRGIRGAGFATGAFRYPNDHTIEKSGRLLSDKLKTLARKFPKSKVALVTHSMGGLVARVCLEDDALDPGNVTRLVMIAPPTHGTMLAHFAYGTDLWEYTFTEQNGGMRERIHASIVDGLAEAVDDLKPNSAFLRKLNSRERNAKVQYTIMLGDGAVMSEKGREKLRNAVWKTMDKLYCSWKFKKKIEGWILKTDEIIAGKGDGVVAIERGRLNGVSDVLFLPFGHMSVTGSTSSRVVRKAHVAIIERLRKS